jgi:ATP-dependent RNA helicase SUPV3L1/SUV3
LVTFPPEGADANPAGYHTMSGYRAAGERAIRIDMLERLADMLRVEDSRGGFEAKADMLSITGMTLEQFADLMQGLGYKAERGEREKVRALQEPAPQAPEATEETPEVSAEAPADETPAAEVLEDGKPAVAEKQDAPETEVFFTFTWASKPRGAKPGQSRRPTKGKGQKPRRKPEQKGAKTFSARPEKKSKIDPDNPFAAALMGLKDKGIRRLCAMTIGPAKIRLDKWLWHARFFKTRSMAAKLVRRAMCASIAKRCENPPFLWGPGMC